MSNLKINALIAVADELVASNIHAVLKRRSIETIVLVNSMHEAIDAMHGVLFNLFIVDANIPFSVKRKAPLYGGIDYVRFIRMCAGEVSEATIAFLKNASSKPRLRNRAQEAAEAIDAGSSCIVQPPFTAETYDCVIEPLIVQPPMFVRTHQYTGPCRRRNNRQVGFDKRK